MSSNHPVPRTIIRRTLGAALPLMMILASFMTPVTAQAVDGSPSIASDQTDYSPGATVILTGAGWQGDASVHLNVNDAIDRTWERNVDVVVAADGSVSDSFSLPANFIAHYDVTATGNDTGRTATTSFADDTLSWDQCQNDSDNNNTQNDCSWTNGALNDQKAIYGEGDVVPQRHLRGVADAGAAYTIFDHSFYDSSKDAFTYDYWATPDFTVKTFLNACAEIPNPVGLSAAQCGQLLSSKSVVALPTESTFPTGPDTFIYPFVAGAEADGANDGVTRNLWISCGAVIGGVFTTGQCSGVSIEILGHGASNGSLLPAGDQQGPPTDDDFVQMKVSYTTLAPSTFVAIWVGGHLAKASYWNNPSKVTDPAFRGLRRRERRRRFVPPAPQRLEPQLQHREPRQPGAGRCGRAPCIPDRGQERHDR